MRITPARLLLVAVLALPAPAQVLARPGWAGSGVMVEPWWRRAVFYRIDPALFQDSNADGTGDLRGIAQRLDYIQSLGVDAIILAPSATAAKDTEGFDDLAQAASQHHLRLLVEIPTPDAAEARLWLNQGAAGLYVDTNSNTTNVSAVLHDLRHLTDSYPGERILITGPTSGHVDGPQLTAGPPLAGTTLNVSALRQQLLAQVDGFDTSNPLLQLPGMASTLGTASAQGALDRTLATMLLASRSAVLFDAGRELGLRSADGKPVAMQWTPSNITTAPPPEPSATPAAPATPAPDSTVYGAFKPYVAPKPSPKPTTAGKPEAPAVDPNTLPGFSTIAPKVDAAANGAKANAVQEDADASSLLNLYRHLIAMHHGNSSIRNGTQHTLNYDAQHTMIWLRRAPAGTRTAASVVVACNLSDHPLELSLRADFDRLHLHSGTLRPLLTATEAELHTSAESSLPYETSDSLILPAFSVFLGELYHDSKPAVVSTRRRRH